MSPLDATTVRGLTREELIARIIHLAGEQQRAAAALVDLNAAPAPSEHALLSPKQAAAKLGVSRATLYAKREIFPWSSFRVPGTGIPKYHARWIDEYLADPEGYLSRGGPAIPRRTR